MIGKLLFFFAAACQVLVLPGFVFRVINSPRFDDLAIGTGAVVPATLVIWLINYLLKVQLGMVADVVLIERNTRRDVKSQQEFAGRALAGLRLIPRKAVLRTECRRVAIVPGFDFSAGLLGCPLRHVSRQDRPKTGLR